MSGDATSVLETAALLYDLIRGSERKVSVGDQAAVLHNHSLGSVALPSGELVACDPLAGAYDAAAFERRVAPGTYPVEVCVAELASGDQRVATALIQLSRQSPTAWELAVWPGQDAAALDAGEFYGYPVDAGTGCFASPAAIAGLVEILDKHFDQSPAEDDPVSAAMEATYVHTWGWANFAVVDVSLVAFHSGYGDGIYPTYWGVDASGTPTCALTDFLLLDVGDPTPATD